MYITFDPDREKVFQLHKGVPSLTDSQEHVGGLVEVVHLWDDEDCQVHLYVNEEGLFLCEPSLVLLTEYYDHFPVRGPVVITKTDLSTGEIAELTVEDVRRIRDGLGKFVVTTSGLLQLLEIS